MGNEKKTPRRNILIPYGDGSNSFKAFKALNMMVFYKQFVVATRVSIFFLDFAGVKIKNFFFVEK